MAILGYDGIKALIKLLETEGDTYGPVLKNALAAAIKQTPDQVERVMQEEFQSCAAHRRTHAGRNLLGRPFQSISTLLCQNQPGLGRGPHVTGQIYQPYHRARGYCCTVRPYGAGLAPSLTKRR